jgi:hypothetical protein
MVLDPKALDEEIRQTEEYLASLKRTRALQSRNAGRGLKADVASALSEGTPRRRSTAWKVADELESLLQGGARTMKEADVIRHLVDGKFVKGDTREMAETNALRTLTQGVNHGYLKRERGRVEYIPDVRTSRVIKRR